MSCDQLIKIMTELEKQTRYWLFIFITQYGHICEMRNTIQLLCLITSTTSAQIGVVMTNNVQEFCCSFD